MQDISKLCALPIEERRQIASRLMRHTQKEKHKEKSDPEKVQLRARVQELEEEVTAMRQALNNMAEMQQKLLKQKPKKSGIDEWLDI